jgi:hypothetical protein
MLLLLLKNGGLVAFLLRMRSIRARSVPGAWDQALGQALDAGRFAVRVAESPCRTRSGITGTGSAFFQAACKKRRGKRPSGSL